MYRIFKRIVRTVTTVTWSICWEDLSTPEQIILPASHSLMEEQVFDSINMPDKARQKSSPIQDEGEES